MQDRQEIRILIETGRREFPRAQEVVIRAIFQRYFARDSYRAAISLTVCQMLGCLAGIWLGLPVASILLIVLGTSLAQGLLRGLFLWASPPPPPPAPTDLAAPPAP